MQPNSPLMSEPLLGHRRYRKVRLTAVLVLIIVSCNRTCNVQIRDLNRGTFGFVQLALDTETDSQVAIKFIERGEKASCSCSSTGRHFIPSYMVLLCLLLLMHLFTSTDNKVCRARDTEPQAPESAAHHRAQRGTHHCMYVIFATCACNSFQGPKQQSLHRFS